MGGDLASEWIVASVLAMLCILCTYIHVPGT